MQQNHARSSRLVSYVSETDYLDDLKFDTTFWHTEYPPHHPSYLTKSRLF